MGCDIHIMAEVKRNGKWEINKKPIFKNPWYEKGSTSDLCKDEFQTMPEDGRSYDWFGLLANVRNGWGFAGVRTGDGFATEASPKGVPSDATDEWKELVSDWDCDMHSHSYFTAEELENIDWSQTTTKSGTIDLDTYALLRSHPNSVPESWSGLTGPKILIVDTETADAILDIDPNMPIAVDEDEVKSINAEPYNGLTEDAILESIMSGVPASEFDVKVSYEWEVTYGDWFEHKIKNIIEPLRELANEFEDARIVFGFDN